MGLTIDQNIRYLLIISFFFVTSCTAYNNEEKKIMKNDCLSIETEEIFWRTHVDKKTEFPLSLYIAASIKEEVEMFDKELKKIGCLSNSMLFIHLNIDNGIRKLHYYTWDHNMKVYHMNLSNKSNSFNIILNNEIIKKDMKIFEEITNLSKNKDIFTDIENKFLLDGSQVYLVLKKNQKIKRFGAYKRSFNRNLLVSDFAKYIKSIF